MAYMPIYAARSEGRVYKSSDNGVTWVEIRPQGDQVRNWSSIITNGDGSVVVAHHGNLGSPRGNNLFFSIDSGSTWTMVDTTRGYWGITGVSGNGNYIYVGMTGEPYHVYFSKNKGSTWSSWTTAPWIRIHPHWDINDTGTRIWGAQCGQPLGYSTDGENFSTIYPNPDIYDPKCWSSISVSLDGTKLISGQIYNNAVRGRVWYSVNSGASWTETRPHGSDTSRTWRCLVSKNGNTWWAFDSYPGRIWVSTNSCSTWTEVRPAGNVDKSWSNPTVNYEGSICIVSEGTNSYKTTDTGASWSTLSMPGGTGYWYFDIAKYPAPTGEKFAVHIYGAKWITSSWLSDPTTALTAVNDALDSVTDLAFSGVQILSSLNAAGTGMAFAICDPVYKGKEYLEPSDVSGLRSAIMSALATGVCGTNMTYTDLEFGTSKVSE
jgi:photosystem II stability/assembly factor-like uncharacterized protein